MTTPKIPVNEILITVPETKNTPMRSGALSKVLLYIPFFLLGLLLITYIFRKKAGPVDLMVGDDVLINGSLYGNVAYIGTKDNKIVSVTIGTNESSIVVQVDKSSLTKLKK